MAVAPLTSRRTAGAGNTLPAGIVGLGACLPERVVTNHDFARVLDTSDEWIRTRTGIVERRFAGPGEATSDLGERAARAALEDAGLDVGEVGAVLVATTTPDHVMPGVAPLVAARLGTEAPALDLNAACSGFVYGLWVAGSLTATGGGPVLLVGAETLTRIVDQEDRSTAVLFGDGAGAAVVAAVDDGDLGPFDLGCDGSLAGILCVPAGGARRPATPDSVREGAHYMAMNGREVYRHAVARMTASARAVLEDAGLTPGDADVLIGHQANVRILDAVAERLGIPPERCHVTVDRHGNTSAASVPLALEDARGAGRLTPGARVLLTAFGAGLTWGSCLLTWGDPEAAGPGDAPTGSATSTPRDDAGRAP